MIALSLSADPRPEDDALAVIVDQDAEPADVDRFHDALDRIVEQKLRQGKETDPQ